MELYKQVGEVAFVKAFNLEDYDEGIRALLRFVGNMDNKDKTGMFGRIDLYHILETYTISEIREKYEEWASRPRIGDEVRYGLHVGVVISYTKEKDYIRVLAKNENSIFSFPPDGVKKTGRHFDNVSIGDLGKYAEVAR